MTTTNRRKTSQKHCGAPADNASPNNARGEEIFRGYETGKRPSGWNPQLNFLMLAYQNPEAKPGMLTDNATALKTMRELLERARIDAHFVGANNREVPEDAVSLLMEQVGQSNILANFQAYKRTFRPYINTWLRRAVIKIALERWGSRPHPLHEQIVSETSDPTKALELEDLKEKCFELLAEAVLVPATTTGACTGASTQYVRKHRWNKERWSKIAHWFPGTSLRPTRRKKAKGKKDAHESALAQ